MFCGDTHGGRKAKQPGTGWKQSQSARGLQDLSLQFHALALSTNCMGRSVNERSADNTGLKLRNDQGFDFVNEMFCLLNAHTYTHTKYKLGDFERKHE